MSMKFIPHGSEKLSTLDLHNLKHSHDAEILKVISASVKGLAAAIKSNISSLTVNIWLQMRKNME